MAHLGEPYTSGVWAQFLVEALKLIGGGKDFQSVGQSFHNTKPVCGHVLRLIH